MVSDFALLAGFVLVSVWAKLCFFKKTVSDFMACVSAREELAPE